MDTCTSPPTGNHPLPIHFFGYFYRMSMTLNYLDKPSHLIIWIRCLRFAPRSALSYVQPSMLGSGHTADSRLHFLFSRV